MEKAKKIISIVLLSIASFIVIGFIFLISISPGKIEPFRDKHGRFVAGSIFEKNIIEIGGIQQGLFIRSENSKNPVILYLHGGPGSPELPFIVSNESEERLEKYFTVCYWDQRGAGISYHKNLDVDSLTLERMIEDTREMTKFLRKRFGKEKIYLMGHSWGSYLGIKTIEKYPEYYLAYIGIGQVTDQLKSEILAYDSMYQHAVDIKDEKAINQLKRFNKSAPDFPSEDYLLTTRTPLMNKYGIGIMHKGFSISTLAKDLLFFDGYSLYEKIKYVEGAALSLKRIFPYVTSDNLFETSTSFAVPVYIVHGKYDYQVSHALAEKYMELIEAPKKQFFTFENSAHSPNLEEPEKFIGIIREIAKEIESLPAQETTSQTDTHNR